jgi:nucleoside diphosphate kinase homolog 5
LSKQQRHANLCHFQQRTLHLTPEQASEFYKEQCNSSNYSQLIMALTAGPIHAMCIAKENAIAAWQLLMGPEPHGKENRWPGCLRGQYEHPNGDVKNALHGSENYAASQYEIHFFFPNSKHFNNLEKVQK